MIMGMIKKEFEDDIDNDDWKKEIYDDDDWSKATEKMRTLRPDNEDCWEVKMATIMMTVKKNDDGDDGGGDNDEKIRRWWWIFQQSNCKTEDVASRSGSERLKAKCRSLITIMVMMSTIVMANNPGDDFPISWWLPSWLWCFYRDSHYCGDYKIETFMRWNIVAAKLQTKIKLVNVS